jgi:hypothetical protein
MSRGTPHVPSTRSARTRRWTYRKTHLFGSEAEAGFTEGEKLLIVDLAGRRVAPLICFAPTGETLVEASQDREELLVVPIAELGGFDEQTDYPKLVRPPRPVKMPEGEAAALTSPAATPTTASRSRS